MDFLCRVVNRIIVFMSFKILEEVNYFDWYYGLNNFGSVVFLNR